MTFEATRTDITERALRSRNAASHFRPVRLPIQGPVINADLPLHTVTPLADRRIGFRIAWNRIDSRFYMAIWDPETLDVEIEEQPLVYLWDFCMQYQHRPLLRGLKIVPAHLGNPEVYLDRGITATNFGVDVHLWYHLEVDKA